VKLCTPVLVLISVVASACSPDPNDDHHPWPDSTPPDTALDRAPADFVNTKPISIAFHATEESTFTCTIDGGVALPCTSPWATTVDEGPHTLDVQATDRAGNIDPTPAHAEWTVDVTPPETTLGRTPPALDNSVDVAMEFSSSEAGTFQCRIDDVPFQPCTSPLQLTGLGDGAHVFEARAIDRAGNPDATPVAWSWTIDTSSPDTEISEGPSGVLQDTSATFLFRSIDAHAGVSFRCRFNGGGPAPCESPMIYQDLPEGDYVFEVAAVSASGVADVTPAQRTWTIDRTAPTVNITGGPGLTNLAAPTFTFSTSGGATGTECDVDGGPAVPCSSPYAIPTTGEGDHHFAVHAVDAAGNRATAKRTFTIDLTRPTVAIDSGPPTATTTRSASFTFHSASDAAATFECALDGAAFAACTPTKTYINLAGTPRQQHTFLVRALDPAHNVSNPASYAWTIDTEGPTLQLDTHPDALTNKTSATFTFHSPSDADATFACELDGAAKTCSSPITYDNLLGGQLASHKLRVRAIDALGNLGTIVTFDWQIDTSVPSVWISTKPIDPTTDPSATFKYESSEAGALFDCKLDSAADFTDCATTGISYSNLPDGTHQFAVRPRDKAGNIGTQATYSWQLSTKAPTILTTPPAGWPFNYFTFSFDAPIGASYECAINGGAFTSCWSSMKITLPIDRYGQSNTLDVRWHDSAGHPSPSARATWTPTPGLALYYPLDRDVGNRAVRAYPASDGMGGTYTFSGGHAGSAIATTSQIQLTNSRDALTSAASYTISLWLHHDSGPDPQGGTLLDNHGCALTGDPSGDVVLTCARIAGSARGAVPADRWVNVLYRYAGAGQGDGNGGDVELFVDGNRVATLANPQKLDPFGKTQLHDMQLGTTPGAGTRAWRMDELRFYNTAYDDATQCKTVLAGSWDGLRCTPLMAGLDYAMDTYPAQNAGAWALDTIATATATVTGGMTGRAVTLPTGPDFYADGLDGAVTASSAHTLSMWFFSPGYTRDGYLFNVLCPGAINCAPGATSGLSAHIKGGTLTVCGSEPGLAAPRCADVSFVPTPWHQLTLIEHAHDAGSAWATDGLDIVLDGALKSSIDFSDLGAHSVFENTNRSLQFGPMNVGDPVLIDEVKLWPASRTDYPADVQCALFDGRTYDYSSSTCSTL
jgi:Concanavalin A-like lectin/glucanases superfamily